MSIQEFMIGLLIMSGLVTGITIFVGDMFNTYSSSVDTTDLNNTFGYKSDLLNISAEMEDDVLSSEVNEASAFTIAAKGVIKSIKSAFNSVKVFIKMVNYAAANTLGIPVWAWQLLISVVTLLFIFAIIGFIQGRDA